jgi:hypothetical protein
LDGPKQAETGRAVVHVGGADTGARTVGPTAEVFTEYALVFEKGSTVIAEVMTQEENGKAFDLEPGTWALSVTAFIEVDEVKKPAVSGSISLSVAAGKTVQAKVTLTESVTDTYGTFDYSAIDLSAIDTATLKSAVMTLTPSNPNSGTVEIDLLKENDSKTLELPAGIYTLLVGLTSGRSIAIGNFEHEMNAYRQETVYIYPYMTTALQAGEYEFVETDFTAGLRFTGTAVIDPYSSGTDTYKPTEVHILKVIDNDGNKIDDSLGFTDRLIVSESIEASIDEYGNWELILPSNLIADNIEAPFTSTDNQYQNLDGYPVFFCFTLQSQEHPNNTMQSRWVWQEINNKYGKLDIALSAKIRKITVPAQVSVAGNSAFKISNTKYDVVYTDSDNEIRLTVDTANNGLIKDTVKVLESGGRELTQEEDELETVSNETSVYIEFRMPDADVTVTAQFFIPKGTSAVRNANNLSGGYTAQQVFVWLDANQDGVADETDDYGYSPVAIGLVNNNVWEFELPPKYQAYSGDFIFQLRLMREGSPVILGKLERFNVSSLASGAETITLVADIRTLEIAGMAGKGDVIAIVPGMRDEDGKPDLVPQLASGNYVAEGTEVQVTVTPNEPNYLSGVFYTSAGMKKPAEFVSYFDSSKTYRFTMPSNDTTVTADMDNYSVGYPGPSGGLIFYVEQNTDTIASQGWKYLEAALQDAQSPAGGGGSGIDWMYLPYSEPSDPQHYYSVTTYPDIGKGRLNTENMIQTIKTNIGGDSYLNYENGAAKACDIFTYGGYNDWFLPSLNELTAMYSELKANYLGNFINTLYWSSVEYSNNEAYAVDFTDGTSVKQEKRHQNLRVRPVRSF